MRCTRCHRFLPEEYKFCPFDGSGVVDRLDPRAFRAEPTRVKGRLLAGRYRIRGFIGKGAMARVYLAEDEQTGMPVAVKVLEDPYRKDKKVRERFHREARSASVIGHPSIVTVFAEGERAEDAAPFLVMEFLVGESVGDYLRRDGLMPPELAIAALAQAASALAATHRVGIVHRDIKPDNLFLIGEPGDPYELKVVDFGLSREPSSNLTEAGLILGTPSTMAPEQIVAEPIDGKADQYALGMVAYRMLSGRETFPRGDDDVATLAHHLFTAPRPLPDGPYSASAKQAVMRAIQKDPADRHADMDAFAQALESVLDPSQPELTDEPPAREYEPQTLLGKLIKKSLGRTIGREES